jgi:hypothetical protein
VADVLAGTSADDLGKPPPMATKKVPLVAQEADRLPRACDRSKLVEFRLRAGRLQMRLVDAKEVVEPAIARGLSAFARRAELAQMQIGDALLVERPGRREAATARTSTSSLIPARSIVPRTALGVACS